MLVGSEFNGALPFLKGLNAGPDDLIPGVEMMAIRSDKNDKYAQPDGRFVGAPGKPTGVGFDATELRGAKNVILDGLDHREVAFHKLAFAAMYEHIAGKPPASMFIAQEPLPVLNGKVTGIAEGVYTNLAVAGAEVEIYEVDAKTGERKSNVAVHRKTTGEDGMWGPYIGRSDMNYEFVLRMSGQPVTHTYRSPFLRSSDVVHLRPGQFAKGDEAAGAIVIMSRPRGYFGVGRDKFTLDGKMPPGINDGVPGVSTGKLAFDAEPAHRDGGVQQRDDPDPDLARQGQSHRDCRVPELSDTPGEAEIARINAEHLISTPLRPADLLVRVRHARRRRRVRRCHGRSVATQPLPSCHRERRRDAGRSPHRMRGDQGGDGGARHSVRRHPGRASRHEHRRERDLLAAGDRRSDSVARPFGA